MTSAWLQWKGARPASGWQGIERLVLRLLPDVAAAELEVHLYVAVPAPVFQLSGGRRVVNIPWRVMGITGNVVTLRLEAMGDHSTYAVTLVDSGNVPIDPFFASADFVFTIDCERGDCQPRTAEAGRERRKRPAVDLLTKDYAGFVNLLSDHVRVSNPHWADLSSASLERVLVELISHHGDMLSYYQDRVANEAFIDEASQRYSLRQHGKLLGYELFDGAAAETLLAFSAETSGYVPEGTEVTTRGAEGAARAVFHVLERTRIHVEHGQLALAAWPGATDAELPAGSSRALLWGHVNELVPGQRLAFVQGAFTQVVSLTEVQHLSLPGWTEKPTDAPPAYPLDNPSQVTSISWEPPLEAAVRPWASEPGFFLYGNLATARFGEQRTDKIPLSRTELLANRQGAIVVRERQDGGDVFLLRALRVPDGPVVFAEQRTESGRTRGVPLIEVSLPQQRFHLVEHLHASQSYDAHCVASADEDGSLWLQFGDGRKGLAIELQEPHQAELTLRYHVGDPVAGNTTALTLTQLLLPPDSKLLEGLVKLEVTNVTPGSGGRPRETKDAARLRIPASLRHGAVERAVSLDDYARAALEVPGVARAAARALGGAFNTVLVLVDPESQSGLTPTLRQAVMERLEQVRMAGREYLVREPEYVPLEVRLALCVAPGALPHQVREAVYAALRPGTRQRPGFFHPDRLSFGEEVELGELLAHVQRLPGVRSVKALRFRKQGFASEGEVLSRIRLRSTEVARLDADDDYPENGRLSVLVASVDPGVQADTFEMEEAV
ncbi:baseplate J/gp47 family protein [Cystobacter ferrugineus]|uniref:Uncharacterized protein n=1 Tax=Cystobacter ferrugineus TaxID=83449 RepID=A0A1L9AWX4_9BACT|nr:baseplate J/gp47 family protein [Cystobacter ferrugineus]OJH34515.1 hypothetical protein BON30_42660 [Cystobacter ferrugineus]